MSFDVNWDIDKYKEEHESDDQWQLRRNFMVKWKSSYPEDRLVCLARVFANIEFMGCRYPVEVMQEVARMSKEDTRGGVSDWYSPANVMYDSASFGSGNPVPEGYYDGEPINEAPEGSLGYPQNESGFQYHAGSESIYEVPQNLTPDIRKAGWYRFPRSDTSGPESNAGKNPIYCEDFDGRMVEQTNTSVAKSFCHGKKTVGYEENPKHASSSNRITCTKGFDGAVSDPQSDSCVSLWAGWDEHQNKEPEGNSQHDIDDRVTFGQNSGNMRTGPEYSNQNRIEAEMPQRNSNPKDIDDRVLYVTNSTGETESEKISSTGKNYPSTTISKNTTNPSFHTGVRNMNRASRNQDISTKSIQRSALTKPLYTTEVINLVENPLTILYPNEPTFVNKKIGNEKIATVVLKFTYHATFKSVFIYTVDKHDGICRERLSVAKRQRIKWWISQGKSREEAVFLCLKSYSKVYRDMMNGKCRLISKDILMEQIKKVKHPSVIQDESDASDDYEIIKEALEPWVQTSPQINTSIPTANELRAQIIAQAKSVIQVTTSKESEVISLITPDSSPVRIVDSEDRMTTTNETATKTTRKTNVAISTKKPTTLQKQRFPKTYVTLVSQLKPHWLRRYKFWITNGKTKEEALLLCQQRFRRIPEYRTIISRQNEIKNQEKRKLKAMKALEPATTNKPMNINSNLNVFIQDCKEIFLPQSKLLWKAIQDCISPDDQDIKFVGSGRKNGCAVVTCANEQSRDWLDKQVPTLMPWPEAQLKVVDETDASMFLARAFFPDTNIESKEDFLNKLHAQNPYLNCDKWKVLNMQSEGDGKLVLLRFPEKLYSKIRAECYCLLWNEDTVRIKIKMNKKTFVVGPQKSLLYDQCSRMSRTMKHLEKNFGINQYQELLFGKEKAPNKATGFFEGGCNSNISETPHAGPSDTRIQMTNERPDNPLSIVHDVSQNEGRDFNSLYFNAAMGQVPALGNNRIPYQPSGDDMTQLGYDETYRPSDKSASGPVVQGQYGIDHRQNKDDLEEDYIPQQMDIDKGSSDYLPPVIDSNEPVDVSQGMDDTVNLRDQSGTYTRCDDFNLRELDGPTNQLSQEDIDGIPLDYSSPDREPHVQTAAYSSRESLSRVSRRETDYNSREKDLPDRAVDFPLQEDNDDSGNEGFLETDVHRQDTDYSRRAWDTQRREPAYLSCERRELHMDHQGPQLANIPLQQEVDIPRRPTGYSSPGKVAHIHRQTQTAEFPFQEERILTARDDQRNETNDIHMLTDDSPTTEFRREYIPRFSPSEGPTAHLGTAEYSPQERDVQDYYPEEHVREIDRPQKEDLYNRRPTDLRFTNFEGVNEQTDYVPQEMGIAGRKTDCSPQGTHVLDRSNDYDPRESDFPGRLNDYDTREIDISGRPTGSYSRERNISGHSTEYDSRGRDVCERLSFSPSQDHTRGLRIDYDSRERHVAEQPGRYNSQDRDTPRCPPRYDSRERDFRSEETDFQGRNVRGRAANYSSRERKVHGGEVVQKRYIYPQRTNHSSREGDNHVRITSRERNVNRPSTGQREIDERTSSRERGRRLATYFSSRERVVHERGIGFSRQRDVDRRERKINERASSRERDIQSRGTGFSRERNDQERATERLRKESQDYRVESRAIASTKRRNASNMLQRSSENPAKCQNPEPRGIAETSADRRRRRRGKARGRGRGADRQH